MLPKSINFILIVIFVIFTFNWCYAQQKRTVKYTPLEDRISEKVYSSLRSIKNEVRRRCEFKEVKNDVVFHLLRDTVLFSALKFEVDTGGNVKNVFCYISNSNAFSEMTKEILISTSGLWKSNRGETKIRFISFYLSILPLVNTPPLPLYFENNEIFSVLWPKYAKCTVYKTLETTFFW